MRCAMARVRSRHSVSDAMAERDVLSSFLHYEHEGRHLHALEPHAAPYGNDHGGLGSGDPGNAPGGSRQSAAGFSLDPRRDPDVQGNDSPPASSTHQRGEGVRSTKRVAKNVLVVALLPFDLCGNDRLVNCHPELAPSAVFPARAAVRRLAASDFFADSTRRPG